jgi:threonine dehydrogenase-like Zn-dependent dehydrogenase
MRAAALKDGRIYVNDDVPEPTPAFGQVLVQVKACGICGSDLHFAKHGAEMLALTKEMSGLSVMDTGPDLDLSRDVYMGHEFSAEVLDVGPDTVAPPAGTIVTSIPILFTP